MPLLEVSHLRKSFDQVVAVDDLSFSVDAGEVFGLVGPNGAGKTTTMTILAGLRKADAGQVSIAGHVVGNGSLALKMMLGVVPQDLAIYADMTGAENLTFFGRIYGVRGAELNQRIASVLELIGLESHADQFVRTYSGGMKRRLNFGIALLHNPTLLILDEPTVGVDPQSRSHLLECVRQLAAGGVAVIYASHYMEEVEVICQRVAIIDHGRMLRCGTLEELIDRSHTDLHLHVAAPAADLAQRLDGLVEVLPIDAHTSQAVIERERSAAPGVVTTRMARVLDVLAAARIEVLSVETREHNLERLFLELTGRKLRD